MYFYAFGQVFGADSDLLAVDIGVRARDDCPVMAPMAFPDKGCARLELEELLEGMYPALGYSHEQTAVRALTLDLAEEAKHWTTPGSV